MNAGDLVRVRNAKREVIATVVHLATVAELPRLRWKDFQYLKVAAVQRLLAEWGVGEIALLTYRLKVMGRMVKTHQFCAFDIAGRWVDKHKEDLQIEPAGQEMEGIADGR